MGDFLYVKHTYINDELKHHNVDHTYLEEINPHPEDADKQAIREYIVDPKIVGKKKFDLI